MTIAIIEKHKPARAAQDHQDSKQLDAELKGGSA